MTMEMLLLKQKLQIVTQTKHPQIGKLIILVIKQTRLEIILLRMQLQTIKHIFTKKL